MSPDEKAALDAGTHEPAVDDFGNQYLVRLAIPVRADPAALARAVAALSPDDRNKFDNLLVLDWLATSPKA